MNICPKCKKEMVCLKTGITIHFGGGHCYAGDKFGCPVCKAETVRCNNNPYHDPHYLNSEYREIIEMK